MDDSDSLEQRELEPTIRGKIAAQVGVELVKQKVAYDSGVFEIDGVAPDESVLVEITARQGKLKGAQKRKVAEGALRLITLRRTRPGAKLILAFADDDAAAYARGESAVARMLRVWDVEVISVDVDPAERERVRLAQVRQAEGARSPRRRR